jgi:hypothetical protein
MHSSGETLMRSHLSFGASLQPAMLGLSLLFTATWTTGAQAQTVSLDQVSPIALTTSSVVSAVRIDPQSGNVPVRTSNGTYNACTFVPPQVPTINSFAPSSSQVTPSSTITLNWSSSNTTHCTAQQGSGTIWSSLGQLPASGTQNITAPASTGTITFQLTCTDGAQSDIKTTQVLVQTGGGGGTCLPTYPNGTTSEWSSAVGTWPSFGVRPRVQVPFNGYLALRFTATAVAGQFGTISGLRYPGDGDGNAQMSISRDAGCFNAAQLPANCLIQPSSTPSIGWINGNSQFSCVLTMGQSYYFNVTFGNTTAVSQSVPFCPNQACGVDLINQIQD